MPKAIDDIRKAVQAAAKPVGAPPAAGSKPELSPEDAKPVDDALHVGAHLEVDGDGPLNEPPVGPVRPGVPQPADRNYIVELPFCGPVVVQAWDRLDAIEKYKRHCGITATVHEFKVAETKTKPDGTK